MGMERYRPKTKGVDGVSDAIATKIKNDAYDKEYAAMMKEYNKRVKAQNFEDKSMLGRGNKTISDADRAKLARMMGKEMGGKVQKMKYGGKAAPVAKVKVERLKKMRDPYGESNFASETSNGKDAYTQRVIAAMKESGQPFMYGGKVKKMRNGGFVNTAKSIQLNPKTGEPI